MLMCSDVYLPLHGVDNKSDLKAKMAVKIYSIQGVKND